MWNLSVIFFSDCFPPCLFFSCNPRGSLQCGLEGRAELLPTSAPRSWRLLRSCLLKLGSAVLFMHQTCLFLAKRRLKCCVWGCPSMLQTQQRGLQHWCYSEQLLAESQLGVPSINGTGRQLTACASSKEICTALWPQGSAHPTASLLLLWSCKGCSPIFCGHAAANKPWLGKLSEPPCAWLYCTSSVWKWLLWHWKQKESSSG